MARKTDPVAALRARLLAELPDDIAQARDAYHRLAGEAAGIMDAKEFSTHQAACKAALGHLESLIKLLRWACDGAESSAPSKDGDTARAVDQLIAEARSILQPKV
ncbi:hypothetical protein [Thalassospira povalilytica]|uniref:Uncharacterized protein n=1 Tax=Thalassospira povalilytica TaxID=732237 RepID=A0A8I1SIX6_9PROT|nr:hypothetical protein [Thalassospira povalilytica]MBN8197767.1 hypothetical protein [Thalassospira povalilytica]